MSLSTDPLLPYVAVKLCAKIAKYERFPTLTALREFVDANPGFVAVQAMPDYLLRITTRTQHPPFDPGHYDLEKQNSASSWRN